MVSSDVNVFETIALPLNFKSCEAPETSDLNFNSCSPLNLPSDHLFSSVIWVYPSLCLKSVMQGLYQLVIVHYKICEINGNF